MASILSPQTSITKMAFTDLIVATLGANQGILAGLSSAPSNVANFLKSNSPASAFSSGGLGAAFNSSSFILGQLTNPVVQLYLNPKSISVRKKVLFDKKQTRGGFAVQFWGHDLEGIDVKAATAYFQLSKAPLQAFELLKTQTYQNRFDAVQTFRGNPIISMLYESQVLNGYFESFDYTMTSEQPYQFDYSFQFTVTQNVTSALSSNIATTAANLIRIAKTGNSNINNTQSAVDNSPIQYGSGWGVQLF